MRRSNSREPGTTRDRLAVKVMAALKDAGVDVLPFDGSNLVPATGYWKQADVYRWESAGIQHTIPGGSCPMGMSVSSWSTMTECLRAKSLVVSQVGVGGCYEIDPA